MGHDYVNTLICVVTVVIHHDGILTRGYFRITLININNYGN